MTLKRKKKNFPIVLERFSTYWFHMEQIPRDISVTSLSRKPELTHITKQP